MAEQSSIIGIKQTFLHTQIRTLNATLEPSLVPGENGEVRKELLKEVWQKLNFILHCHNCAAYSSQAIRHVAEKINDLYWDSELPDFAAGCEDIDVPMKGGDLTSHDIIQGLPTEWQCSDAELHRNIDLAKSSRYEELRSRLHDLDKQRQAQKQKYTQYQLLQQLITTFANPRGNLQSSMETVDGELAKELEALKDLVLKVKGKLGSAREVVTVQPLEQ